MKDIENMQLDYTDATSISFWAINAAKYYQVIGIIIIDILKGFI
jgi:hypothetical protein